MKREQLSELHYICPVVNVASIMQLGILAHNRAEDVKHISVAMQDVQAKRHNKRVPAGLYLHDYVNLYICARNPAMFKLHAQHEHLCVLRVSPNVLDMGGVIVTDRNAAHNDVKFALACDGLEYVDEELVFAKYWTHPDNPAKQRDHKSIKCAEVLAPYRVGSESIIGGYVSCKASGVELRLAAPTLQIRIVSNRVGEM